MTETTQKLTINLYPILILGSITMAVLKLAGVISWSWWIVVLPLLVWPAFLIVGLTVVGVVVGMMFLVTAIIELFERRPKKSGSIGTVTTPEGRSRITPKDWLKKKN